MAELTNHEKALFNARSTGIKQLGPILCEIYDKISKAEERIAKLEAEINVLKGDDVLAFNRKNSAAVKS